MSARNNTFIDAYGLELNDELQASYAEPTRREAGAVHEPARTYDADQKERSYRFDAAARHRTLRGPHFDTRRAVSQASDATSGWDAFDANVIDVGAAWAPTQIVVQQSFHEQTVTAPQSHAVEPAAAAVVQVAQNPTEAKKEAAKKEVAKVVAQPIAQSEVTASGTAAAASVEQPAAVESEVPSATTPLPAIDSPERFAPVWEVDRFKWPDEIEQLFKAQTEYFDYAGKKLVAASREGLSILAITSTRFGEGSTTLALCLARAAAGAGAKVGLLDGNLVRSELGEKLGVDFASGWQSAATSEQPLAEAAITGLEEGITLFPSSAGPVADIESLGDERVGQLLRAAAANFDLLIIDAGQADFGKNVDALDAAIVVRDIRHTSEADTLAAAATLRSRGVKAVGIAENFGSSQSSRAAA